MKTQSPITAEGEWCPWHPTRKRRLAIQPVVRGQFWRDTELVAVYTMLGELEQREEWQDICLLVRLILGTGLRVSEAIALNVEDCDADGVILVRRGKGGKRRSLRCTPEFLPFLQARIKGARGAFISSHGLPIYRKTAGRWWNSFVAKCRANSFRLGHVLISQISIHGGRHTYATHEIAWAHLGRLQPHQVQAQLGHSSLSITLGIYTHAMAESLYQAGPPQWWAVARGEDGTGLPDRFPEEGINVRLFKTTNA